MPGRRGELWVRVSRRVALLARECRQTVAVERAEVERRLDDQRGVLGGQRLVAFLARRALGAVRPVADGLDDQPVDLPAIRGEVNADSFHFTADRFLFELEQRVAVVELVDQLAAAEQGAEADLRPTQASCRLAARHWSRCQKRW